jgi:RNA polymerase sigma-70 factor (ECF subfamily)
MADTPKQSRGNAESPSLGAGEAVSELKVWFIREVLPLEAELMQFLRQNWRNESDIADLRQDIYVRVYQAACDEMPSSARGLTFTTARNLLIDRVRRSRIVPIEAATELVTLEVADEQPGPDRNVIARDELRRVNTAVENLSPRIREAFVMRQVQGLSRREIADRMGISEKTVKRHLESGVRALADLLYGDPPNLGKRHERD